MPSHRLDINIGRVLFPQLVVIARGFCFSCLWLSKRKKGEKYSGLEYLGAGVLVLCVIVAF